MKNQCPQVNTLNERQEEWEEANKSSKVNRNLHQKISTNRIQN